jgi:NADPH:quinone reductase
MRALIVEAASGPFQSREIGKPVAGAGEVLVRVCASGVNPLDLKIRAGAADHARHSLPGILGIDLAGVVEAVGQGVETFKPGDEIYGMTGGVGGVQGSLAEYAAVDARLIARKPGNLSMREAAALPLVAITAWEGLVDRVHVGPGQTVLVIGAAGGVGHIAVQMAQARGAKVYGVDRDDAADYLRSLGAVPIDRRKPVAEYVAELTDGAGFDVVYDCVGALEDAFLAVGRFGHVTSSLGWSSLSLAPLSFRAASYSGVFTLLPLLTGEGREAHQYILEEVARLVETGKLVPRVEPRRFSLEEADDAHALVRERGARGKVVIDVMEA